VTVVEDEGAAEDEAPHRREEEGAGEPTTTILQAMPATNAVNPVTLLITVRLDDSQKRNTCNISYAIDDYQLLMNRKDGVAWLL
jgi:hypothetical protein